jgi:hypothetical protein
MPRRGRDEVLWIHESLIRFFRDLFRIRKKEEKSAAKKVTPIFRIFFSRENFGENSEEIYSPKNLGENWNFPQKKFQKIISTRNFEENSAENPFPRKNVQKMGPWIQSYDFGIYH